MKRVILVSIALLLLVTACTQDLAPLREQEESDVDESVQVEKEKSDTDVVKDATEIATENQNTQQPANVKEKLTEMKCKETWKPLANLNTPLLKMEEGKIIVMFRTEVAYQQAISVLKEYDAEFEEAVEILPLGKKTSNEEKYNMYKRLKARVAKGKEIQIACKILQDKDVEESSVSVITDFASLAKAAKK